ncbi:hypothetical protein ACTWP5_06815 [Streptomyces sp. 4N509B]|uniref:hypothetical protein n=1 Tax=Streptomyces sp. 4N509B TaxID=3457413 RepID=UPI003FD263DF
MDRDSVDVLLIGGRAGSGKTTVGWEVSARLAAAGVAHALVEGDLLGQVHPAPDGDPDRVGITERNLAAVWRAYAELGCRRLVYTRTVCVLPEYGDMVRRAVGVSEGSEASDASRVRLIRVLLTASDETATGRLVRRELGSRRDAELRTSALKAPMLDARAPSDTVRVATDGRTVVDVATDVVAATGWLGAR